MQTRRHVTTEINQQQQLPSQHNNNNNNQPHSSPRIHFLPHQHLSSPAFPVSPISSNSPDSSRRFSHQQAGSSKICFWDESLEQLSRELQHICRSGSRDSLSNSSTGSRPSSPWKTTVTLNLDCQSKVKTSAKSLSPLPSHTISRGLNRQSLRRVSLSMDFEFDNETFARLDKIVKGSEKSPKCHRSHEDIHENAPPKLLKSILKPYPNNQFQVSLAAEIEIDSSRPPAEEINNQVFDRETGALKPGDFGFPEFTMKKIKVRHEETELSLNRTLAKICRSKNTFLIQKETSDSSTDCSLTQEEDLESENPIENKLLQLETPVVVVANIQQLLQQKLQQQQQQCHATGEVHLEQISETTKDENEVRRLKINGTGVENKSHAEVRREVNRKNVARFQNSARESSTEAKRANLVKSSIQSFRQKRFLKFSQGAKSLGKSFENVGIRFKVDLKERNPHSIGVSVDEETGFLTVFATTYSKSVNYDSGLGETPSVGSSMNDRCGENFSTHKPSISSDNSDASLTPSIEQLHLLRLGESTKPECLRCSFEDGVLRIREIENEAEFLSFDGISTKYLPIMTEDIVNCHITVTLFVPQEFRGAISVKTIDNILVFSGVKGQFSDRFGSRNSQDVSDDDDGYDAASELSSHSSLTCTPPSMACLSFQGQSSPAGRGSLSSVSSSSHAIPINSQSNQPSLGAQTFKVALNLPPETITRTIEAWLADCGQLIVTGKTTGVGRRMTCNF